MIKSTYSYGKLELEVRSINVPAYLEKSCKLNEAILNVIISKTFNN